MYYFKHCVNVVKYLPMSDLLILQLAIKEH